MNIYDYALIKRSDLIALADVYREKTGTTDPITMENLAIGITNLKSGETPAEGVMPASLVEDSATTIIIEEGTTSIGQYAFSDRYHAKRVILPNGLIHIDDYAFYRCYHLSEVNIPDSVVRIGREAFCGTDDLISITIPASVTEIGTDAFFASGLTDIYVPWDADEVDGAPWGAPNATIHYNSEA